MLCSCVGIMDAGEFLHVVKFKADYSNNAIAFDYANNTANSINHDNDYEIPPSWFDIPPIKLTGDYYLFAEMRYHVVILSISREEAENGTFSSDSIKSLIIDDNPIEEWWFRNAQGSSKFRIDCYDSVCRLYDTAALNEVINEGKLKRYFDRVL
ncbi:MAG: hypothetical protein IKX38_05665 [Bacteroidales bacterium]|nr:hypothetical protein [Bacteroidales bacterium]